MKTNNQKGVSLLLTLLIMSALLAIALGLSQLSLGEIKLTRDIPKSAIAYYAAEAGIERAIYDEWVGGGASNIADCSVNLDNGSSYGLEVSSGEDSVTVRSIGCYKGVRRAIEVSFSGWPGGTEPLCSEGAGSDDEDCGIIDCSGWYVQTGTESPTGTEYCYNKDDITENRCEGEGDCKDPNSGDCASQGNDALQYSCGTCKYISSSNCAGTILGSCSNYSDGTDCGSAHECCQDGVCEVATIFNQSICYNGFGTWDVCWDKRDIVCPNGFNEDVDYMRKRCYSGPNCTGAYIDKWIHTGVPHWPCDPGYRESYKCRMSCYECNN